MRNTLIIEKDFSFMDKFKMTYDDLQVEPNFLVENFLAEKALTMFFAKGGSGKSYLLMALSLKLIKEGKVSNVFYCDMDNSLVALKRRGLDKIIAENPEFRYIHASRIRGMYMTVIDMLIAEGQANKGLLEGSLIVLDSIRDFIIGRDMNSDRDIMPVMEKLKILREAGATVVFLHHTSKEGDGKTYKGSTAFRDSVDIAYFLGSERKGNRLLFTLKNDKDRLGVDEQVAFDLNTETMEIQSANFVLNSVPEHKRLFIAKVEKVLEKFPNGLTQTALLEAIDTTSDDKTARSYLLEFSGKFWRSEKVPHKNNATYFYPILPESTNLPMCA